MKICNLLLLIFICSCGESTHEKKGTPVVVEGNDTIPLVRKTVKKEPVASWWVVMDKALDRKFGVAVYETPRTFHYLLSMQYDGMVEKDSMEIPNFGIWPVIRIVPGEQKLSCIIGFMDANNNFKEYKLLSAKNNRLSLTTLKYYAVVTR